MGSYIQGRYSGWACYHVDALELLDDTCKHSDNFKLDMSDDWVTTNTIRPLCTRRCVVLGHRPAGREDTYIESSSQHLLL